MFTTQRQFYEPAKSFSFESLITKLYSQVDIHRSFLSVCNFSKSAISLKRFVSEPNIYCRANHEDLCSPWPKPEHPTFKEFDDVNLRPKLYTWKFVTIRDIKYMKRHMFDRDAVKSTIEQNLPDSIVFRGAGKEIFLSFSWEIFKYMRDNDYSSKGISSILGLFYLTHRFFLSTCWRTALETLNFFRDGLNFHASLKPPKSDLIFNYSECDDLLDMFRSIYLLKLELVRLICIPRYNLTYKINTQDFKIQI